MKRPRRIALLVSLVAVVPPVMVWAAEVARPQEEAVVLPAALQVLPGFRAKDGTQAGEKGTCYFLVGRKSV